MKKIVSAIVSTYNSERFIKGCLDDLLKQTLGDKLEIIVINSASTQGEDKIISRYLKERDNIKYIKTAVRENIYRCWNRGLRIASGKYLINANCDDRSRPDAFEIMAKTLDENPQAALVYADVFSTKIPNETLGMSVLRKRHWFAPAIPDYSHKELLQWCFPGPRPMWRKKLHKELGFFDESFVYAGDYDFWLRVAERYPMLRIPQKLHLIYLNKSSISLRNRPLLKEEIAIKKKYFEQLLFKKTNKHA